MVLKFEHVQLAPEHDADALQAHDRIEGLEDVLAFGDAQAEGGGDQVGQPAGLLDVDGVDVGFFGQAAVELDALLEQGPHGAHQRRRFLAAVGAFVDRPARAPATRLRSGISSRI